MTQRLSLPWWWLMMPWLGHKCYQVLVTSCAHEVWHVLNCLFTRCSVLSSLDCYQWTIFLLIEKWIKQSHIPCGTNENAQVCYARLLQSNSQKHPYQKLNLVKLFSCVPHGNRNAVHNVNRYWFGDIHKLTFINYGLKFFIAWLTVFAHLHWHRVI
jgi:hypothetical protein